MFKISDKRLFIPFILAIVGTLLMVISVFLPYLTATESFAKELDSEPNVFVSEEMRLTTQHLKNHSMLRYAKLQNTEIQGAEGIFHLGMVYAILATAFIAALFSVIKKPIPVIVFTILSFVVFAFQNYDLLLRKIISDTLYTWGYAYYLFYAGTIIALVGGVSMLLVKILIKKELKVSN